MPAVKSYIEGLFSTFSNSAHVMDFHLPQPLMIGEGRETAEAIAYKFGLGFAPVSMLTFSRMRIALPERKRKELSKWPVTPQTPEQFTVFFNGAIFLALSDVERIPVRTDIGQIARELIFEILGS